MNNNTFDSKDYSIFIEIEQQPNLSLSEIAKRVSMSKEMVRLRIQKMKKLGFLRPKRDVIDPVLGKREQSEVEASYIPHNIGLLRQHVLFTGIKNIKYLNKLIEFCDQHPYTHYRSIAYGNETTLYVQFDIPPSINNQMKEIYSIFKNLGYFNKLIVLDTEYSARTLSDFKKWNIHDRHWELETGIKNTIENLWQTHTTQNVDIISEKPHFEATFDTLDAILLRELTINSNINMKHLGEIYKKDPTTISRRIKKIRENFLDSDRLYYDRQKFDIAYNQLIYGEFTKDFSRHKFVSFINNGAFPFYSRIFINNNEFIWYVMLPPYYAVEISELVWTKAKNVSIMQLYTARSFTYYFYHLNYLGNNKWRTDEEYIKYNPLRTIELEVEI